LQKLAQKAISSPDFLKRLRSDPAGAAAEAGVTLTDAQANYIRGLPEERWTAISQATSGQTSSAQTDSVQAGIASPSAFW
jgi:hypothetical protein